MTNSDLVENAFHKFQKVSNVRTHNFFHLNERGADVWYRTVSGKLSQHQRACYLLAYSTFVVPTDKIMLYM
jgi:hypothetical protein